MKTALAWKAWVALAASCLFAIAALADNTGWRIVPGPTATDIGIGADGTLWTIGSGKTGPNDYAIYRYSNGNVNSQLIPGAAVRIDVDPNGNAWVVNSTHQIFRWTGSAWQQMNGGATDIGIGSNGAVWIIGTNRVGCCDYGIWKWDGGGGWQPVAGGAVRIAVDNQGNPWVVNSGHQIFHWSNGGWSNVLGGAIDVGVGGKGAVWILDTNGTPLRLNGSVWVDVGGSWAIAARTANIGVGLSAITVDKDGNPWGVDRTGRVLASNLGSPPLGYTPGSPSITFHNSTQAYVWVTLFGGSGRGSNLDAVCVTPWQTHSFDTSMGGGFNLRVEMTNTLNCSALPDDAHVVCRADGLPPNGSPSFRADANKCWLEAWDPKNTPTPPPVTAPASLMSKGEYMTNGQSLTVNQYLQSPAKRYYAIMQTDGNLCVYKGTPQATAGLIWCTNRTAAGNTQFVTAMQTDGNLCTYIGTPAGYQANLWCSSAVAAGQSYVTMQDDGNLCVYKGAPYHATGGLWCHNTNVGR
jgi:hypothetical protein